MLRYYKSEADYRAKKPARGILNFQQVSFEFRADAANNRINLQPKGCRRVFALSCANKAKFDEWSHKIQTSINMSIGFIRNLDTLWYEQSL